jgi:probable rRNA maturation factor
MRELNRQFRGKDYATDVLSFPSPNFVEGFSGDIAVSADIASKNARSLGHSVANEVKILVLHGVLHLAGFDHESDDGEVAEKESRLRMRLGLPAALIERSSDKIHPTSARKTRARA